MPDTAAPRRQSIPACQRGLLCLSGGGSDGIRPRRARGVPAGVRLLGDDGRRGAGPRRFDEDPLNLGDLVGAVMEFASDGDQGAQVIEDMLSTGLIRLSRACAVEFDETPGREC